MKQRLLEIFSGFGFSPKLIILFLAGLPVTELRASIPIGILVLKEGVKATFLFSVIGNIIPIVPIYFLLDPVSKRLSRTRWMARFFEWLYRRAKQHGDIVERYEALGLMLFVALPSPGTGAWTGAMVASILRMRFWPAFLAVSAGVIIAAVIVTIITLVGRASF